MNRIPSFFYSVQLPASKAILYKRADHRVVQWGDSVRFTFDGPWRAEYADIFRNYSCDSLAAGVQPNRFESLRFLSTLPNLRSLSLLVQSPLDVSVIGELGSLTRLRLEWRPPAASPSVDFAGLTRLAECSISLRPGVESALSQNSIRVLRILDCSYTSILDLTALTELQELDLMNASKLVGFALDNRTELVAFLRPPDAAS